MIPIYYMEYESPVSRVIVLKLGANILSGNDDWKDGSLEPVEYEDL